jgi:hypothetical protein
MMTMEPATLLKDGALPWLLEPDAANPGVRYWTLRDLLDRPADDREVQLAQQAVMTSGPVPAILDAQDPAGFWVKPGTGYGPKYRGTEWQVIFLGELGADPSDERVRRGCAYVLAHSIAPNGGFSVVANSVASGVVHCLNGNLLVALQRLGFGDDSRVQAALDWQARAITGEGDIQFIKSGTSGPGFCCAANYGLPCGWGAVKAVRALLAVPPARRTPAIERAIQASAEFLLSRDPALADYPYLERVSSTWFKFGFLLSYWSDVLELVMVLAQAGYGNDPRLDAAWRLIMDKQDAQGRWRLENSLNGKTWQDIETKGQPSKWITLRAHLALKAAH